jgi:hypothetical protein
MKRSSLFLILLVAAFAAIVFLTLFDPQSSWSDPEVRDDDAISADVRAFNSAEGRFALNTPVELKPSSQEGSLLDFDLDFNSHHGKVGETQYWVTYVDLPPAALGKAPATTYLDALGDSTVSGMGAIPLRKAFARVQGFSGRQYRVRLKGKVGKQHLGAMSTCLVGRRIYLVGVLGPPGADTSPEARAFLASFRPSRGK